jgi:tetratricopeptide (TPR) repeat protein
MKRRVAIGISIAALLLVALWLRNAALRGLRGRDKAMGPPRTAEALERVHAARSKEEVADAERILARAEALKPDAPSVPYGRGLLLENQGHHREAIAEYERALELYPNNTDALYHLALSLAFAGRTAESAKVRARFDQARDYERERIQLELRLQRDPDRADLWRRLLALSEKHGDDARAQTARQQLDALASGPPAAPP